jgi:hypothetical protein
LVNAGGFGNAGAIFAGGTITSATASHNSITSAAASNLTLGTGSFGTATVLASATGAMTHGPFATFQSGFHANSAVASIDTASSGVLGLKLGVLTNSPSNSTDAFVGVQNTGGPGATAGDLLYIARSSVAASHRWFTGNGGAITSRMVLNNAGDLSLSSTTASTSTTTGSLINAGGFGNAGAAYFGSTVSFTNQLVGNRASGGDIAELTGTSMTAGQTINFRFGSRLTSGNSGSWNFTYQGDNDNTNSMGFGYYGVANILTMTRAGATTFSGSARSTSATGGIGYATGAGGAVTQGTSRTTGVTLNNVCGAITLFTAAGSATWQSFTVTNSVVAATDTIIVNQRSGTDLYMMHVTAVGAGSFRISFATTGGTTSEAPVFNFAVIKAVSS